MAPQQQKSRPKKASKQIFRGKVFVLSGESGLTNGTHANISKWIIGHGGQMEKNVSENTTHLICTIENFKNKVREGK